MKYSSDSRRKEYRMIELENSLEHNDEMWSKPVVSGYCQQVLVFYPSNSIDGLVYKMEVVIVLSTIVYKIV